MLGDKLIGELLVDEGQDLSQAQTRVLHSLASLPVRMVVAADHNQAIVRSNVDDLVKVLNDPLVVCLDYSYRLTRETSSAALAFLEQQRNELNTGTDKRIHRLTDIRTAILRTGLTGPRMRVLVCNNSVPVVIEKELGRLLKRYAPDEIAVLEGFSSTSIPKWHASSTQGLNRSKILREYLFRADEAKGREWKAGLVAGFGALLEGLGTARTATDQLRLNAFYVAVTRFRNEVVIIESNIDSYLGRFLQEAAKKRIIEIKELN